MPEKLYLIVHNIRSAYNVGSIFRTAEGLGVAKIYLTGYTPSPYDQGQSPYMKAAEKMIAKTALGAEQYVPWERTQNAFSLINKLKKKNFQLIGLELCNRSINLSDFKPSFPCALVLGNETGGIPKDILDICDAVVSIPMRGRKESFNVSIAAGIAAYAILAK